MNAKSNIARQLEICELLSSDYSGSVYDLAYELAGLVVALHTAPKRKPRKAPAEEAEGSPGGRAWSKAARGSKTYESAQPDKISARAMSICAREEDKRIIPPRPGAVFRFRYSPNGAYQGYIVECMAKLAKLGVTDIQAESREEYEATRGPKPCASE